MPTGCIPAGASNYNDVASHTGQRGNFPEASTPVVAMNLLAQIQQLAADVAQNIILPGFAAVQASHKQDGSLLTKADIQAHRALSGQLPGLADFPVLSEEMSIAAQQAILDTGPADYWCIDPIDGTTNFVYGVPYWCVSIALIVDGQMHFAVVYDPNRKECFSAQDGGPAMLNDEPLPVNPNMQATELEQCLGLIDFKRLQPALKQRLLAHPPYRSQRSFGASALDLCWIAAQRCHLYLHGRQYLWDHAAGLLILQQAGGQAQTFQGEAVFQNNLLSKSVLAASSGPLMEKWRDYFQDIEEFMPAN